MIDNSFCQSWFEKLYVGMYSNPHSAQDTKIFVCHSHSSFEYPFSVALTSMLDSNFLLISGDKFYNQLLKATCSAMKLYGSMSVKKTPIPHLASAIVSVDLCIIFELMIPSADALSA